jgi:DNA-binding NarL/FixJ family response regulator
MPNRSSDEGKIKVLIAEDQGLMREGLKLLLSEADDIKIVGEARDGQEAVDGVLRLEPDVVLMDIRMPYVDGLSATEYLRSMHEDVKILIISGVSEEAVLRRAMHSGAQGYFVKYTDPLELPVAIRAVARGEVYFSPEVFDILSEEWARK